MSKRSRTAQVGSARRCTVGDVCQAMGIIAPPALAQSWDNVGLLAGDLQARVRRMLLCIDLTEAVVDEARTAKVQCILNYHPPIFKPISMLQIPGSGTEAAVFRCIRDGIAIYATHTALDAAEGGTNDVIASLCGIKRRQPLEHIDQPGESQNKLVVFVPQEALEKVADAIFAAGAGHIGDYSRCSYRLAGQGTFRGGATTSPTIGQRGRMEYVDEVRLESVVRSKDLPAVVAAMRGAHPYEEPAFDLYPLQAQPVGGIGRVGRLPQPIALSTLARKLKRATGATCVQIVGPADRQVDRAIIVVGAAGSLPFQLPPLAAAPPSPTPNPPSASRIPNSEFRLPNSAFPHPHADVIITGEIRHHDALTIQRRDCTAIVLGHWASERPVLTSLAKRLETALPGVELRISKADRDPFQPIGSRAG